MARTPTPRVAARQTAIAALITAHGPLTVRRLFYISVGAGIVPKTEAGYDLVVDDANVLRDQGTVGYDEIIDPTRITRQAEMWEHPADAADWYASGLRLDPWQDMPSRVAVTCESDGLAVAIAGHLNDTPLRIVAVRGHGSSTAIAGLAEWLADADEDATVLHIGDADGQGIAIEEDIASRLSLHADRLGSVEPTVERIWLSATQARLAGLPSRPAKLTQQDIVHGFTTDCWEAEAGDPADIARLIRDRMDDLLDPDVLDEVAEREQAARKAFAELAGRLRS